MPHTEKDCFFSLFQLNDRFMDDVDLKEGDEYQYAESCIIVTKVLKIPPKTGKNSSAAISGECAYIDGVTSDLYNSVHLKIDKMTAGKYIVFYSAKFRKDQLCRKMNVVFYSPQDV